MNPPPKPLSVETRQAILHYGTPDFDVLQTGDYVVCAVSGKPIPLERLTYWSVELQEAYANADLMTRRWVETHPRA
ncbi:DUF2093 domain-containing protein [Brevundimonas sp.]|uniref:DUF2093 domain-containing protein n=1 Tax=Brevundimonas sp. TaxID=1871086 RepID=UPI002D6939BA|nr:DUF2093 domain-containing protein [Brevundimonas sp.]HYC97657.1 DUF2093 domain-containing protein [Brevundimonas sp.]